jgi:hypothetical protein
LKAVRESATRGLWTLPDGRVVFYPHFHNTHGYLVETRAQARRIRWALRAAIVIGYIAIVPALVVTRLEESRFVLLVAMAVGFALDYGIMRWLTRGFPIVPEPMSPLRRLRLRALSQSTAASVALAIIFGTLAIAAIAQGLRKDDLLAGFALGALCALGCFAGAYTWHIKRSTRI